MGLLSPPSGHFAIGAWLMGAVCAARLNLRLPGVGVMPMSLAVILVGAATLGPWPTAALACLCAMTRLMGRGEGGYEPTRMALEGLRAALAAWTAHAVYHLPHAAIPDLLMLLPAGAAYLLGDAILCARRPQATVQHLAAVSLASATLLMVRLFGWPVTACVLPAAFLLQRAYHLHVAKVTRCQHTTSDLHWRMVEALALAIEAKDGTTHGHLRRVQIYAGETGRRLGFSEDDMTALRTAALLHDIGKLAIPEHIISKPGKLNREEFEKMKAHTIIGAEILQRVGFPEDVALMVRAHHERWNGKGYPDGLSGEGIPLGARVLAAADFVDALSSDRQYRRALPLDEAVEMLVAESGQSFDPAVVDIIQANYRELEALAKGQSVGPRLSTAVTVRQGAGPGAGLDQTTAHRPSQEEAALVLARAREEFTALLANAESLNPLLATSDILAVAVGRLKRLVRFDTLAIYAAGPAHLEPIHSTGSEEGLYGSLAIPAGGGVSGWVADNARAIVNANPVMEVAHLSGSWNTRMRSALAVPLDKSGNVLGVLSLYRVEPDAFSQHDLSAAETVGSVLAELLEARLKLDRQPVPQQVQQVPSLSRILERLQEEIERARWNSCPVSLLVVAGFPPSGPAGEVPAVCEIGGRALRAACREDDYLARLPDGRFFMILPGAARAQVALRRQQFAAAAGAGLPQSLVFASASYPENGLEAAALVAHAEKSLTGQEALKFFEAAASSSHTIQ